MNRQRLHTALSQATTSTFEELGLLLASDAEVDDASIAPPPAGVRVDFTGPWAGSVVVRVSDDVLDGAAANMLGSDAPPAEPLRRDALGELANVICGNVLPAIAGREAVFSLRPPRWIGDAATPPAAGEATVACTVAVETGCADVTLHLPAPLLDAGTTARPDA